MPVDPELKKVWEQYAALGATKVATKYAAPKQCIKSASFTKFCKDAGLWIDKGNKFNTKPPNRVDYVFTYACTNGPEGRRGNKEMSAAQFTFALRGVAKETGWSLDEVEERAKNCSVQLNATEAISTRFHDDKSNYTGSHKHMHADVSGQSPITDKAQIRRNRTLNALPLDTRMEALKLDNMIGEIFMKHDKNRSGLLEPEELESALKAMQPDADVSSMRVVSAYCLRDDNDGKLSLDEFKVAFNMIVDTLELVKESTMTSEDEMLLRAKFNEFAELAPNVASPNRKNSLQQQWPPSTTMTMDSARFKKLCNDAFPNTYPKTQAAGSARIDVVWADMLKEARQNRCKELNTIKFIEFFKFGLLSIVKDVREVTDADANLESVRMVICETLPSLHATDAEAVRFHDDKRNYTGTHATDGRHGKIVKQRSSLTAGW